MGERRFVLGAAFEIFEGEARQPAMRHRAQILDRYGAREVAAGIKAALRRRAKHRGRGRRQGPVGGCKARQRTGLPRHRSAAAEGDGQTARHRGESAHECRLAPCQAPKQARRVEDGPDDRGFPRSLS